MLGAVVAAVAVAEVVDFDAIVVGVAGLADDDRKWYRGDDWIGSVTVVVAAAAAAAARLVQTN